MSILSAGRILRKSISDILELVICELDLLYWFRVTFVIFKLVIFFPFSLTFTINQQNKHAFGLIPGQYCLVFLHDLTALLAGKQLYKNHMGVLFRTPRAHNHSVPFMGKGCSGLAGEATVVQLQREQPGCGRHLSALIRF